MGKKAGLKAELDTIEGIIALSPQGLNIADLEAELRKHLPQTLQRRTLLRRLDDLISQGRIITAGKSVALLYKPAVTQTTTQPGPIAAYPPVPPLHLTPAGEELRQLIRRPRHQRIPVGYRRDFLEAYLPNTTWYLPDDLRARLHQSGRSPYAQRPAGTYARAILGRLLIDLSWASSQLEGNTYTRLDTQRLIEYGQVAEGKDILETQMILNHKAAIEMLVDRAEAIGFNAYTFLNLHAALADNLLADPMACGRLRWRQVDISGTVFLPLGIPQQISECFQLVLEKAAAIRDPFEQAFFLMVHLPYLQPFEDVNKRVSRLAANIPFILHNLTPLSFIDVPERDYVEGTLAIYELCRVELLRDVFAWAYERSCQRYAAIKQTLPEPDPFRLRNRQALAEAIQAIVRSGARPEVPVIRASMPSQVGVEEQDRFIAMVLAELENLYEGNIERYRLYPSEYKAWRDSLTENPS